MEIKHLQNNKYLIKDYTGKSIITFIKDGGTEKDAIACFLEGRDITQAEYDAEAAQWLIDNPPEPKQKTIKVMKPFEKIVMIDGVPVLKTGEQETDELVFEEVPVVDEAGKPVMRVVEEEKPAEFDDEGNEIARAQPEVLAQMTHKIPVMEDDQKTTMLRYLLLVKPVFSLRYADMPAYP